MPLCCKNDDGIPVDGARLKPAGKVSRRLSHAHIHTGPHRCTSMGNSLEQLDGKEQADGTHLEPHKASTRTLNLSQKHGVKRRQIRFIQVQEDHTVPCLDLARKTRDYALTQNKF